MEFKYNTYIPSTDQFKLTKQLRTREYIELLKYITNNDQVALSKAYDELIQEHVDGVDINALTRVDKFFILITIRAICVGPVLSMKFEDEKTKKPYTSHVELFPMLQRIADIEGIFRQEVKINNDLSVCLSVPAELYVHEGVDMIANCITGITVNQTKHDLTDYEVQERVELIDALPGNLFKKLQEFIQSNIEKYSTVDLFKKINPHDLTDKQIYKVNLFDASMFDFINISYNESLNYIRDVFYILQRRCNFNTDYLLDCTFAEVRMYVDLYEEEIKQQEKEQQKNKNAQAGMAPLRNPVAPQL